MELVHQQHFISFGSCILKRSEPQVSCDGSQLLRQRHDLQVHHQVVDEVGVRLSVIHKLENGVRVLENPRQQLIIKFSSLLLQLSACQVTQIVISLPDQLLGIEESVNEEATA